MRVSIFVSIFYSIAILLCNSDVSAGVFQYSLPIFKNKLDKIFDAYNEHNNFKKLPRNQKPVKISQYKNKFKDYLNFKSKTHIVG